MYPIGNVQCSTSKQRSKYPHSFGSSNETFGNRFLGPTTFNSNCPSPDADADDGTDDDDDQVRSGDVGPSAPDNGSTGGTVPLGGGGDAGGAYESVHQLRSLAAIERFGSQQPWP